MTVPGATSAPRLTWRSPSTPANGAVIVRSATDARLACTLAAAASRLARRVSYCPRAMSCALASSAPRRSCWSASRNAASAAATSACCARLFMSASSCPACTRWPLSNASRVTTSLTLAVMVTDSFACAVPSACNASLNGRGCTTVVVTVTGRPAPGGFPAAASCLPQAASASSDRHANAGPRNRSGAFFDIDGIHSRQPSEFSGWLREAGLCRRTCLGAVNRSRCDALRTSPSDRADRRRATCA